MRSECSITIAVPVYNIAGYLEKCIDSILAQTVSADEIILIDDGSTDGSSEICDRYAADHGIIRVLHKANEGLGLACNSAIEVASGTHIVFIDGDDRAYPSMIEVLKTAYQSSRCAAVLCGYDEISEDGRILATYEYGSRALFEGDAVRDEFLPKMMGSSPGCHDSICVGAKHVLYSLDMIKKNGVRFPSEREIISEDMFFNLKYYLQVDSVALIPGTYYAYVQRSGSLTKSFRSDRFEKVKRFHCAMREEMLRAGVWEICATRFSKTFFINLRMCIAQEAGCDDGLTSERLSEICNDELVQQIIAEYPVELLGFKQRFFVQCIRKRCSSLLRVFIRTGVLR